MKIERDFHEAPLVAEVLAALERIASSEMLRSSPKLTAFLRFVVGATLRGEGDRIKGYTIAVEALGRGKDFDPQLDPIVRVEAGRLRRAMTRYYAGPGAADAVVIEIPRGTYVPVFRHRIDEHAAVELAGEPPPSRGPSDTADASGSLVPTSPDLIRGSAGEASSGTCARPTSGSNRWLEYLPLGWRISLGGAILVLGGIVAWLSIGR
jgi:hypothetical protein